MALSPVQYPFGPGLAAPLVRIAWGNVPLDATYTYTDETAYLRSARFRRGRINEVGVVTPGDFTLILENTTRRFDLWNTSSPIYADLIPGTPVQLCIVTADTTVHERFTGYIDRIRPRWIGQNRDAVVEITGYDGFEILGGGLAPDSAWFADIADSAPYAWFRLGETSGITYLADASGNGHDGTWTSGTTSLHSVTGLVVQSTDKAIAFSSTPDKATVGASFALDAQPLTIAFLCSLNASAQNETILVHKGKYVIAHTAPAGGGVGTLTFIDNTTGTPVSKSAAITTGTHFVVYTLSGTTLTCYIDGSSVSLTTTHHQIQTGESATLIGASSADPTRPAFNFATTGAAALGITGATAEQVVVGVLSVTGGTPGNPTLGTTSATVVAISNPNINGSGNGIAVFYRVIDGTEGTTISVNSGGGGTPAVAGSVYDNVDIDAAWLAAVTGAATLGTTTQRLRGGLFVVGTATDASPSGVTNRKTSTNGGSRASIGDVSFDGPATTTGYTVTGSGVTLCNGVMLIPRKVGGPLTGTGDEFVCWSRALSAGEVTTLYDAAHTGWPTEDTGARLAHVLNGNWPAALRAIDTGIVDVGPPGAEINTTLLAYGHLLETIEQARFFMTRKGEVGFYNRDWPTTNTHATAVQVTFSDVAAEGEGFVDITDAGIDKALVINDVKIGSQIRLFSKTSQRINGLRSADYSNLNAMDSAAVAALGTAIFTRYATPKPRVNGFVVYPETSASLVAFLAASELGDRVEIKFRPIDDGGTHSAMDQQGLIEQIIEEWPVDGNWRAEFAISPLFL